MQKGAHVWRAAQRHAAAFRVVRWCLAGLLSGSALAPAAAQDIWFGAPDNLRRHGAPPASEDFLDLFRPGAPGWTRAVGELSAISIAPYYVDQAPEEDIRRIVSFAHSQGLKLIVGILPLPVEGCGRGVEGLVPDVNRPMATLSRLTGC